MTILPWLVRHAAFLRGRYGLKSNGVSAHRDAYHTDYKGLLVPFGESIFYQAPASSTGHMPGGQRQYKADSRWHTGIFLGRTILSKEALVARRQGGGRHHGQQHTKARGHESLRPRGAQDHEERSLGLRQAGHETQEGHRTGGSERSNTARRAHIGGVFSPQLRFIHAEARHDSCSYVFLRCTECGIVFKFRYAYDIGSSDATNRRSFRARRRRTSP